MTVQRAAPSRPEATPQRAPAALAAALLAILVALALGVGGSGGRATTTARAAIVTPAQPRRRAIRTQAARRDGQALEQTLRSTPYVTRGSPDRREIALTFDDGPGPDTPRVMQVLLREHVPATFFFVGQQVRGFGSILREEHARGFAIGNHTENHAPLGRLRPQAQLQQLEAAAQGARRDGVDEIRFFRPPYGSYDRATFRVARRLGLLMVLWSADTGDYRRPGVNAIVGAALRGARPGAIVLMHDAGGPRLETVRALPRIIRELRRRAFRLVTVPQMLADAPPPRRQRPPPGIGR